MFTEDYKKISIEIAEEATRCRIESIEQLLGFSLLKISCNLNDHKIKYGDTKELEYIANNEEMRKNFFDPEVTLEMESYEIKYEYEKLDIDYLIAVRNYHESLK